jgi:hypothetical protein
MRVAADTRSLGEFSLISVSFAAHAIHAFPFRRGADYLSLLASAILAEKKEADTIWVPEYRRPEYSCVLSNNRRHTISSHFDHLSSYEFQGCALQPSPRSIPVPFLFLRVAGIGSSLLEKRTNPNCPEHSNLPDAVVIGGPISKERKKAATVLDHTRSYA